MIVDDEPLAIELIDSHINKIDNLEVAAKCLNAMIAMEVLREKKIDLIFMDIQMPQMNGIDATKKIRQYEKDYNIPQTPIIALTAGIVKGEDEKCLQAGMDGYISKPINQCTLFKTLKENLPATEKE